MKKNLTALCAVLMLGMPLASFAQPGGGPEGGPGDHRGGPQQGRAQPPGPQPGHPQAHPNRAQPHPGRGGHPAYRDAHFRPQAGLPIPHQEWRRGHVVEPRFRDDRYWVTDWRARHLSAPPPEHRWLHVNGDYVLVAIATGVITSILTGY